MTYREKIIAAAVAYAIERSWAVFPADVKKQKKSYLAAEFCKTKEHPEGERWGASNNPTTIRRRFSRRRCRDAGIGLDLERSGVWVLDKDTLAGHGVDGGASLRALTEKYGPLPETLTSISPTESEHFYFKQPSDGEPIRSSAAGKLGAGLDVKGAGGMVILPPTARGDGAYSYVDETVPIADAPAWLVKLARNASEASGGSRIRPGDADADAAGDAGADTAGDAGADDDDVDLNALAFAVRACPNLGPDEVEAGDTRCFTYDDMYRFGAGIFNATKGAEFGRGIYDGWKQKYSRYEATEADAKWRSFRRRPLRHIGAGTIFYLADRAAPGWREAYNAERERASAEALAEMEATADNNDPVYDAIMAERAAMGNGADGETIAARPLAPDVEQPGDDDDKGAAGSGGGAGAGLAGAMKKIVDGFNQLHALVLAGDKAVVMRFDEEPFRLVKVEAIKTWYKNTFAMKVGKKSLTHAELWLTNRRRRSYAGIEFAPTGKAERRGWYNLFQGFAVEPREGDCSKFLAHIRDNIAQGDEGLYNWVIGWFAQIFQQPTEKTDTALAFRGPQGVGKTIVGLIIGSLLGHNYKLVADPRYVVGNFNAHMASLLLLQADEGFFAGDKRAEGRLKDLVSGKRQPIEYKGIDAIWVDNFVRLLVTSNEKWVVPAGFDERRFCILDVGNAHMQDTSYFAAIDEEMRNGGLGALLHHFLTFKLSTVDLRKIPQTAALLDQKLASAAPEEKFWFDLLNSGKLPGAPETMPNKCLRHRFYDAYVRHAGRTGARHRAMETKLGIFLKMHVGDDVFSGERITYVVYAPNGDKITKRGRTYQFPPLAECRRMFEAKINQEVKWGDVIAWQADEIVEIERADEDEDEAPF